MDDGNGPGETATSQFWLASAVTALSLALVVYRHIKIYSFWSSRGIKGPTPWPFLGTQIYYMFRHKTDVHREWRQKYGHTYGIYEGRSAILRTSDNELVTYVCFKNFSSFTDRNSTNIFGDIPRKWLFWSKGEHWVNQRALITPMFTSSMMKMFFQSMSACIDRFVRDVDRRMADSKAAAATGKGGDDKQQQHDPPVFSKDELMALTLDVIATSFFSVKLDTYRDKTSDFFKRAFAFAKFDVVRFIWWCMVPTPVLRYFKIDLIAPEKYEYFEKLSQAAIDERRKNSKAKLKTDLVQAFLDARIPEDQKSEESIYTEQDDAEAHYRNSIKHNEMERIYEKVTQAARKFTCFDDTEIRAQMTFLFMAGFETTASTLAFCFYTLAHEQEAQEEVYQELVASRNLNGGQMIGHSELLSLKKLDSFISETLRLYAPVPEHIRMVTSDGGVVLPTSPPLKLPKGFSINIGGWELQRDEDYWERPNEFDLTRFYPENRDKIKSCTFNPFGLGRRNCAGMGFALLEMKLCLSKLLLKYRVHPGPNTRTYPPKFTRHAFFLQFKHTDFTLTERSS